MDYMRGWSGFSVHPVACSSEPALAVHSSRPSSASGGEMQELNSHDIESTVFSLSPVFQKTEYGHRFSFLLSAGCCVALTELNVFFFCLY